jgi:uncharacterized protein (TIGR03437 family)
MTNSIFKGLRAVSVLVSSVGLCSHASGQSNLITTVAGNGNYGYSGDGGLARSAALGGTFGLALDAAGNIFIGDCNNNRVRKVSPAGVIATVAGNGSPGFAGDGGPASSAALLCPAGVTVDSSGNLYIADGGNNRIRKVSASGIITTVAGNGSQGFAGDGGTATLARLNGAGSVAVDASGNLFVADTGDNPIRKISSSGIITTVAGGGNPPDRPGNGGPAISASLSYPGSVAVDLAGNLFIADSNHQQVRKVSAANGVITAVAGNGNDGFSGDGGPATSAAFFYPYSVTVDAAGNLYVADTDKLRVRKVSSLGTITTIAGGGDPPDHLGDNQPATAAQVYPGGGALDAVGNLFIADAGHSRIREVLAQPGVVVSSANNSADYASTVAQGSLFVVFGYSMGPATLAQVSAFPLPDSLSGTSVTVTSGATLNCPMIYTSAGQLAAILPSNTPPGPATITVSYNGKVGAYGLSTTQITVAVSSVGIFTLTSSGQGAGIFTALDGSLKSSSRSAKPGEVLNIWATGLGAIGTPDNVLPATYPSFPNVQVWVGVQSAQVAYAGRSGCCAAIDQIVFTVPAVSNSCNIPVVVVRGGVVSNTVTLPVNTAGDTCVDSGPALPSSFLTKAQSGQPVNVAAIGVGPRSLGKNTPSAQAVAGSLSGTLHVGVSETDAARLIRAYASGKERAVRIAMAKYAREWKALDAQAKARALAQLGQTQEGASAVFGRYSGVGSAAGLVSAVLPPPGACLVLPHSAPFGPGAGSAGLDAGQTLSITGAGGSVTLTPLSGKKGQYHGAFAASVSGPNVPLGSYTVNGTGGTDIGRFSATIGITSHIALANKTALTTIDRTLPLTVTWTGGVAGQYVLIGGYSPQPVNETFGPLGPLIPNVYFACAEDAGKGSLTVPGYIVSSMNATGSGKGVLAISPIRCRIRSRCLE